MTDAAPVALMSCMRNEGIHIVEWVAYHRVIGFGQIVICTNDCQDGSDDLLDRLSAHGVVDHLPHRVPQGIPPQHHAIPLAHAHLGAGKAQWLAHLDSDEFLNIAPGAGPVPELIGRAGAAHAVALPWRAFGDNGHTRWPGETLPAFTACEAAITEDRVKFKSLYRFRDFGGASEHMPTAPVVERPLAVNAAGEPLAPDMLTGAPRSRYHPLALAMQGGAVLNHYAVRSTDVFLLKNERGRGAGPPFPKYHLGSAWHRRSNRNEAQDRSILARWPDVQAEMARLRALPGVAGAEAACRDWFAQWCDRTLTPETIRRWTKGATR
jgi:Glycosyl transferase family 2